MRLTVYKSTFSSANSRGASSNSHACFIVLTRLSQVRRGLQACWRPEGAPQAEGLPHVFAACRTISRFLYPYGRQPFIWAGHCCPALATYPRVHRSGPLLLSYLVLLRVGFALPAGLLRPRCGSCVSPHHSTLTRRPCACAPGSGGILSVALSVRIPSPEPFPAVSRHAALWRPDFPPVSGRLPIRQATPAIIPFSVREHPIRLTKSRKML